MSNFCMIRKRGLLLALCWLVTTSCALAQDYPNKTMRLIVGVSAGGGSDMMARMIAAGLSERVGQTVLVDNRTGSGGTLAAEIVAQASPDGYTLMWGSANFVINPLLYSNASYNATLDFAPVTEVLSVPLLLTVNSSFPAKNLSEFIALARNKPGTLNYATPGNGSIAHLMGELFKSMAKIDMVHIPYKGASAVVPDLLAGRIQLFFPSIATAEPFIKSGKMRGLAVTSRKRLSGAPEYPTMDESGVPGYDVAQWYGVLAPAKTPRSIVERLQRDILAVVQQPKVRAQFVAWGGDPIGSTPDQFSQHIRSEVAKWDKVIKQASIRGN